MVSMHRWRSGASGASVASGAHRSVLSAEQRTPFGNAVTGPERWVGWPPAAPSAGGVACSCGAVGPSGMRQPGTWRLAPRLRWLPMTSCAARTAHMPQSAVSALGRAGGRAAGLTTGAGEGIEHRMLQNGMWAPPQGTAHGVTDTSCAVYLWPSCSCFSVASKVGARRSQRRSKCCSRRS